jgi:acetyltransferase-like isoleucine patch superfamily enzyme
MRLFWILRLWIYSIFMGSFNVLGYLGKPIFFKGFSKIYFGKDVRVFPGARIESLGNGKIFFGDYVRAGHNLFVTTTDKDIKIGDKTILSANIFIGTQKNDFKKNINQPNKNWFKESEENEIIIGERCFIGFGAVLLPGTKLGKSCVVGANAVLSGSYDDFSVIAPPKSKVINKLQ